MRVKEITSNENMTNTEKAIEISTRKDIYTKSVSQGDIINAALLMAEWKDQQFKEYLEKKLLEEHTHWNGYECIGAANVLQEIINELFKEKKK